jgi:hypothetical protein
MILNPNGDMYYSVGDKIFYNPLLMMQEAKATNQEPKFHFFDEIIDTFDWTIDYTKTHNWDQLCRDRAMEIRRTWKKVRVWYSGGRDSYLALKSFVNNGIFIDEIAVMNHNYPGCEYPVIINWLKTNKHLFHPDTVIREVKPMESDFYKRVKGNWAEDPGLGAIIPIFNMTEIQRYMLHKEHTDGTAEVCGLEKPRVFKGKGDAKWTQYYNDADAKAWVGCIDIEPFFISKTVPIFQYNTHHLVNYIEDIVVPKYNITDYDIINTEFFKTIEWTDTNGIKTMSATADSESKISPFWFDQCEASLRTEYADWYTGLPVLKLGTAPGGTRVDPAQYTRIQQEWAPETMQRFKNGVMLADSMYTDFYENGSAVYNTKLIHSKYNVVN